MKCQTIASSKIYVTTLMSVMNIRNVKDANRSINYSEQFATPHRETYKEFDYMDTTKQFILMCEKAQEIQDLRPNFYHWNAGDFIHNLLSHINECYSYYDFTTDYVENSIWIPRMDQLWEMISEDSIVNLWAFGFYMSNDYKHDDPYMMDDVKSVEQGLLMFVMKIKHNKRWTGKDWVKIDV